MHSRCHRPACSLLLAVASAAAVTGRPAAAQTGLFPWGAAPASPQAAPWQPDVFADYLLSGQTPHPAVVRIVAAEREGASLGSGVLVDASQGQGLVLTNWHVVRDTRSAVLVQFPDGFQAAGTVVRGDETWDLAAIVIWKPPATPIPLAAAAPVPGDLLTIAGYGRGPYRAQTGRCTEYLSPATGYPQELVELAAGARQGDSGGPILNDRGELAGILFGQNSGRTIGSCSTRLRAFLAAMGSDGFTAADAAALQTQAEGAARGPRIRPAAVTLPSPPGVPSSPPVAVPAATAFQPPAVGPSVPPAPAWPTESLQNIRLPTVGELAEIFDVTTHGQALLSAAGGLALAVLGVRTLWGGRRRRRPAALPDE